MIRFLSIRQLAVIESLDLSLGPGLTVLTGETGAGKSVLVEGSLGAIQHVPRERLPGEHERNVEQRLLTIAKPIERHRGPGRRRRERDRQLAEHALQVATAERD